MKSSPIPRLKTSPIDCTSLSISPPLLLTEPSTLTSLNDCSNQSTSPVANNDCSNQSTSPTVSTDCINSSTPPSILQTAPLTTPPSILQQTATLTNTPGCSIDSTTTPLSSSPTATSNPIKISSPIQSSSNSGHRPICSPNSPQRSDTSRSLNTPGTAHRSENLSRSLTLPSSPHRSDTGRSLNSPFATCSTGIVNMPAAGEIELFPDFTAPDELSSLTLMVESTPLYVHKEILAMWSPVFRSMFTRDFKEKESGSIDLPGKSVEEFIELLHCMYPPIKPITDANVYLLLPLVEEYQITEVKKKCEEFLLTKSGSMELLITAQQYGLQQLLGKCIDQVRSKSFGELQKDPHFKRLEPDNLISILQLRVMDLEASVEQNKKAYTDRDSRMYGVISELASGYGNFCTDCKSRKINDNCSNCLKMFRDKVKTKCEEAKTYRLHNPLFSRDSKD